MRESRYYAVDLTIEHEETGVYVRIRENENPPFIFYNNTPFLIHVKRTGRSLLYISWLYLILF